MNVGRNKCYGEDGVATHEGAQYFYEVWANAELIEAE